ncbi:MAG: cysteine desulfurase [Thermoproteota archaeon]|nr:MAG: cysteine desulfurase [Candidatus Korarchaeota archaeon]
MLDPYEVRKDFPTLARRVHGRPLVYLDNAATSQKPKQVLDAIMEFYAIHNANVHRGAHMLANEATELYESAHDEVAKFIGARDYREVVFTRNTTESLGLIAYAWGLQNLNPGDELILTLMDHHSNILPWLQVCKVTGAKPRFVKVTGEGMLDYSGLEKLLSERTRLVAVVHVSNVLGVVNDVRRIARLAHKHDAIMVVDGAQSVPHIPVDVKELECDFLAFSGHKMLGPTGIGVLYAKLDVAESLAPHEAGGGTIRSVSFSPQAGVEVEWSELPWRLEPGTPNLAGAVGLAEAVRYLKRIGMSEVESHEKKLLEHGLKRLGELDGVEVYGPRSLEARTGIIPFNLSGLSPHEVALILDEYGIAVRSGYHCAQPLHEQLGLKGTVSASFYLYNTIEEVDMLADAITEVLGEVR